MARSIGRYQIREELGRGGMAAVYLAHDPKLEREVALKLLDQQLSTDPTFVARFEREAKTVASLEHNAIVPLHDYGEADGWLYLVMRYMRGGSLKQLLTSGSLTTRQAYGVVRRIGSALDKAHSQGVVHRDLKPGNILLDEEHESYLSDFGIVKVATGEAEYLTQTGQALGTFAYMSPEQVMGREVDGRSDIYALGFVLYEMLTGQHPFGDTATTSGAMAVAHAQQPVPDIRQANPAAPAALNEVIQKATAKNRDERYASCREMTLAMYEALTRKPEAAAAAAEQQSPAEMPPTPKPAPNRPVAARPEVQPSETRQPAEPAVRQPAAPVAQQPARPVTRQPASPSRTPRQTPPPAAQPAPEKKSRIPFWLLALIGIVGVIGIAIVVGAIVISKPPVENELIVEEPTKVLIVDPPEEIKPETPSTTSLGDTQTRPVDDMVMVYVPAGRFLMGSEQGADDELPAHEVSLDAFWIDQTEVTNAQYDRCVTSGECAPSQYADDGDLNADDQPVVGVNWSDAEAYCAWAGGQLPTEAQWEYAARGEHGSTYPWGYDFDGQLLNYCDTNCELEWKDDGYDDGYQRTAPVGSYPDGASWVGAYDMAGNVSEWVSDWYDNSYYNDSPSQNPAGPASGEFRVLRGGSWFEEWVWLRSSDRVAIDQAVRNDDVGFRCAFPTASLGDTRTRPADDMVMVYVPAGRFPMGSDQGEDDEQPVHEVSLANFWIDRTEVTNAQYSRCVADGECNQSTYADDGDFNAGEQPVVGVNWSDAKAYCAWAGGQLPTEAQWEYAARGEDSSTYPWGDGFDGQLLNYCDANCEFEWKDDNFDDGYQRTAPVGNYPGGASWAGARDMAGNVSEWVSDWYDSGYYNDSPSQNPTGPASGEFRVVRGAGWLDEWVWMGSFGRVGRDPTKRVNDVGFRCAAPGP